MTMLLKNQGVATLTHTRYVDGTPTNIGSITIGAVDLAGNTVVASGTATTNNADGTYSYTLASQSAVKVLQVTWTPSNASYGPVTNEVEVVGTKLFTEAQARAYDNAAMASTTVYTDADIEAEHTRIADLLETWTGRSWIRRYRLLQFEPSATNRLFLADAMISEGGSGGEGARFDVRAVLSATVDGTSVSPSDIRIDPVRGILFRTNGLSWGNYYSTFTDYPIEVEVEYGAPRLFDGVDRMALQLLRMRLVPDPTDFAGRTTSLTTELGFYRIDTLPIEVREWVKTHDYRSRF
jgi:hypothetical protein